MIIEKEIEKLFQKLLKNDVVHVKTDGIDITVSMIEGSNLSLSTTVYFGSNFIPKGVRSCIDKRGGFEKELNQKIPTYLSLDEDHFRVNLNYLGRIDSSHRKDFKDLLENFSFLAEQWKRWLDEHDRNDLVHVRVK